MRPSRPVCQESSRLRTLCTSVRSTLNSIIPLCQVYPEKNIGRIRLGCGVDLQQLTVSSAWHFMCKRCKAPMSGNKYGSSVVKDVDWMLDVPVEHGQHAQDCVPFEQRPCVTLIAATSTQLGDTGDEHDGHGTKSSNIGLTLVL